MNSVDTVVMYCFYLNNIKLLDDNVKLLNNFLVLEILCVNFI